MKVEVYGNKWLKDRVEKQIVNALRHYPIVRADIYLKEVPKECLECMYFPCKERCIRNEAKV
jgi:hypothetical protein